MMNSFLRPGVGINSFAVLCLCIATAGCNSSSAPTPTKATPVVNSDPPADPAPPAPYQPRPAGSVTFTKDIAPIVFRNCAVCHRPGEIAPFSLLSYSDVKKRAKQIAEITQKRIMPPWSAVPGYCKFEQDRNLSVDEIGLLGQWASEKTPEGKPSELPPLPNFPKGWKYGKPDLVVTMPEPYVVPAGVRDIFRKFAIHVPIEGTKYVRAIDFDPGNRSVLHHMRLRTDQSSWSRYNDEQDPLPGYDGTMLGEDVEPDGFFLVWAPGYDAAPKHGDRAWQLSKGTDLVLELHLDGTGKDESIQSSIALYFTPTPPKDRLYVIRMANDVIDIPAGDKEYVHKDQYKLPVDVTILSVFPHAHYLAKDMKCYAVKPDGEKVWLIRVVDWDFNWQRDYAYVDPISLPKGTTIYMQYTYDNSAANPRNPQNPPKAVRIGRGTYDEMGDFLIQAAVNDPRDSQTLMADLGMKEIRNSIARDTLLVNVNPNDSEAHYNLGLSYSQIGELPKAAYHYQESLRIRPNYGWAVNNLGSVYRNMGRTKEAADQYLKALKINPKDARAHNNLGFLFLNQDRLDQASVQFEEALRINPEFAEADNNMGVIALKRADPKNAVDYFQRALKANPNYEMARMNLIRTQSELAPTR